MTALSPLVRALSLPHEDHSTPQSGPSRSLTQQATGMDHTVSTPEQELHRHSTSETLASTSSSSRRQKVNPEHIKRQRSKELEEPSEEQQRRAGIASTAAPGASAAAAGVLAGGQHLRGGGEHEIEDKHHIWHKGVTKPRKSALKKVLFLFLFITVWMWICLPIFWGSTYKLMSFFHALEVHLVSFDQDSGSFLNYPMAQMAREQATMATSLGWSIRPASDYPNGLQDVENNVLSQKCWATVVINANATTAWRDAVTGGGGAEYDPTGAIIVYLQTARFYQVTLLYIEALIGENLMIPLTQARASAYQEFVASVGANVNGVTNAAAAPQALGVGFGYNTHDLRSIGNYEWSGAAPMEAALIYYVIFAFYIALFGAQGRMKSGMQTRLSFRSMLVIRLGWPLLAYFFLSLWFTLIERAWQVPVSAWFGAAGFVVLWMLNYVTLIAGGLAMETVLAIVGLSWLPFFLILWIIPSSFYPIELMPQFYHFLRWTPFLHNVEGFKIIAYGTDLQHRLGKHFGILFGLIGVEFICLSLAIFYERWSSDRSAIKEQKEKEKENEHDQ